MLTSVIEYKVKFHLKNKKLTVADIFSENYVHVCLTCWFETLVG